MQTPLRKALWVAVGLLGGLSATSLASWAVEPKGELSVAVTTVPAQMGNPYQGITLPAVFPLQAIFDTLTTLDRDGRVIPALALGWEAPSPDVWIFKLRPNVVFSNGEPFDANAVVVSTNHITSQLGRAETIGSTLYQVKSAQALDALTVRITLNEADPLFPLHAGIWRMAAPKLWAELGPEKYITNPVGTGPFVLESRTQNRVVLRANPSSWRAPKLAKLTLSVVPEEIARVQALMSGAIDIAYNIGIESKQSIADVGAVARERLTSQVYFLPFSTTGEKTPVHDARVRRALNMAVNRKTIVEQVFAGTTKPASQLSIPGAFGYDDTAVAIPYDPQGAKKLLAEAGYPNGFAMKMGATTSNANDPSVFQLVAADLKNVGVTLDVLIRTIPRQQQDMFTGRLDVEMFNSFTRGNDPLMDYRHRACIGVMPERHPYHCDAQVTEILHQLKGETDLSKRASLYAQIVAREQQSPPGIMLWQGVEFDGLGKRAKTYAPLPDNLNVHLWEVK